MFLLKITLSKLYSKPNPNIEPWWLARVADLKKLMSLLFFISVYKMKFFSFFWELCVLSDNFHVWQLPLHLLHRLERNWLLWYKCKAQSIWILEFNTTTHRDTPREPSVRDFVWFEYTALAVHDLITFTVHPNEQINKLHMHL